MRNCLTSVLAKVTSSTRGVAAAGRASCAATVALPSAKR